MASVAWGNDSGTIENVDKILNSRNRVWKWHENTIRNTHWSIHCCTSRVFLKSKPNVNEPLRSWWIIWTAIIPASLWMGFVCCECGRITKVEKSNQGCVELLKSFLLGKLHILLCVLAWKLRQNPTVILFGLQNNTGKECKCIENNNCLNTWMRSRKKMFLHYC